MRKVKGYFSHHKIITKRCVLGHSVESLYVRVPTKKEDQ